MDQEGVVNIMDDDWGLERYNKEIAKVSGQVKESARNLSHLKKTLTYLRADKSLLLGFPKEKISTKELRFAAHEIIKSRGYATAAFRVTKIHFGKSERWVDKVLTYPPFRNQIELLYSDLKRCYPEVFSILDNFNIFDESRLTSARDLRQVLLRIRDAFEIASVIENKDRKLMTLKQQIEEKEVEIRNLKNEFEKFNALGLKERILKAREVDPGLSQAKLAKIVGVTRQTVAKYLSQNRGAA